MNWKEVTPDLYKKIKPIGGSLISYVDDSFLRTNKIRFWIEFEMNEFIYVDPFYGEQKSTAPFKMNIKLIDVFNNFKIKNFSEIENLEIKWSKTDLIGAFSNSLHFSVPFMKFGQICTNEIPFKMEYCLTNSYSYAMMDGTIEEHIQQSGMVEVILKIDDLLVRINKKKDVSKVIKKLNSEILDLNEIKEVITKNQASERDKKYMIPYKL